MKGQRRLPRAKNPSKKYAIPGSSWNRVIDRVESQELVVSAPLSMTQTPAGIMLSVNVPPASSTVVPVKITGLESMSGLYMAAAYKGSINPTNGTTALTLPSTLTTSGGTNNALVMNPPELSGSGSNHALLTGQWGTALKIGTTTETPSRTALIWLPGWTPPTPRPIYTVLMAINSNGDLAFDGPRFT